MSDKMPDASSNGLKHTSGVLCKVTMDVSFAPRSLPEMRRAVDEVGDAVLDPYSGAVTWQATGGTENEFATRLVREDGVPVDDPSYACWTGSACSSRRSSDALTAADR